MVFADKRPLPAAVVVIIGLGSGLRIVLDTALRRRRP
jgi:hypothetical protein